MDFSWSDIYQDFLNSRNRKSSEQAFQRDILSVFRYYLRWQNGIVEEECIHIGSTNTIRPDFVLYKNNVPQVVIESKEPNHIQIERDKAQLFSYMRQKKVDFGLYIGEVIQLYYDVPTDVEPPLLIFTLEYDEQSQYGSAFVGLFNFIDFDKDLLAGFCLNRLQEIEKVNRKEQDIQNLMSDDGVALCKSLLKSHFVSKGYSETETEMLFDDMEITIRRKSQAPKQASPGLPASPMPLEVNAKPKHSRERQKYSINGMGVFNKGECAFELVRQYIKDHPSTFNTLVSVFNAQLPYKRTPKKFVISKDDLDIWKMRSGDKYRRWREDCPLVSNDGITFYVTTQVGDDCPIDFRDIISLSMKLGYKIEPL